MLMIIKRLMCLSISAILVACGSNLAPVSELNWHSHAKMSSGHRVQRGETLYAIAFKYDTDYRTLARINHILPPYSLRIGQIISLRGATAKLSQKSIAGRIVPIRPIYSPPRRSNHRPSSWIWPVSGRVVVTFIPQQGKKGINIACKKEEMVLASRPGIVAYAGNGLSGYGNLVIIKHDNQFLTAYANNSKIRVKEGQRVKAGQIIGQVGVIDYKYTGIHFEIRKSGIPVNPLNYLEKG